MTRRTRNLIIAGVVIASITGLLVYLTRPKPVAVTTHTVERGRVEATVANTRAGTIKACRRAKMSPAIGGQVASLPVSRGERVKAGQVLLTLWNKDLAAQLKLAQSEEKAARSRLKEACLFAESAQREAQRLLRLKKKKLTSDEAVDRAVTEAKARQEACEAARASLRVSRDRITAARAALERTILRAPFAGVVAEVNAEVGEYVTPSPPGIPTPPAIDLVDDSCIYVRAPIDEVDAPAIRVGMAARITLDALPGKHFKGKVRRVASYVLDREKQARTVDVDVEFENPEDARNLLAGYSADIEVILKVRENVLRVPTEAVLEGHRVLVYDKDTGVLREKEFKPGVSNWQYTEVLSGLEAGAVVVTSIGREGVIDGARAVVEKKD